MAERLNQEREQLASNGRSSPNGSDLLEVRNLKTYFYTEGGVVPAVDGVSFSIKQGETVALVGESGCGKSVTSLSITRLVPIPPGRFLHGEVLFRGKDLLKMNKEEIRSIRGNQISMIFQEPMTSLNPVFTVGNQISESFMLHQKLNKSDAKTRTIDMLRIVGIPAPERRMGDYPHRMSGGMRQRVMIAMALACNPKLLIADEPTTALDVTIQAQILKLMKRFKKEMGMSIMLITHDLGIVADIADRVYVMYAGKIVESADVKTIFKEPKHPYTVGLLGSIPKLNEDRERLQVIEGNVPDPYCMPQGCRFNSRCSHVMKICTAEEPELLEVGTGHTVSCWLHGSSTGVMS